MRIPVHIIAPYEAMVPIIQECVPLFPKMDIQYSVGDLVKGAEIASIAQRNGAEVIISRGGTAQLIKKTVTIPVIDMQLSGYDMIRSLTLASRLNDKTAIVGFSNITSGAQSIVDLMDLPLKVYTIHHSDEVASLLLELKASGYRHIVGDVITFNTANACGLNGFLMQSGKESIIKSLEDAQFVHSCMANNDTVSHILNSLVIQEHPNIIILNEWNEVIFEHFTHFNDNPLLDEHMHLMNANLSFNKAAIRNSFVVDNTQLSITAYEAVLEANRFKVYLVEKDEPYSFSQKGITVCSDISSEPIASESPAMRTALKSIEALYKGNEAIHMLGAAGSGKSFIVSYIHQQLAAEGLLLKVDLAHCAPEHLSEIPLAKVRTVEITLHEPPADRQSLLGFIERCHALEVRVFVISERTLDRQYSQSIGLNTIMIPSLFERMEDIPILIQYFLTDYYHKYGTSAVKIKADALKLLEEQASSFSISQLKDVMKQAALNEKDYVISSETLRSVLSKEQEAANTISLHGTLREIEKEVINLVLREENNNQSKAAERLGINRATLWRKLKD